MLIHPRFNRFIGFETYQGNPETLWMDLEGSFLIHILTVSGIRTIHCSLHVPSPPRSAHEHGGYGSHPNHGKTCRLSPYCTGMFTNNFLYN